MIYLRRLLLPQTPPTSTRNTFQVTILSSVHRNGATRRYSTNPDGAEENLGKFVRVETTGYSFVDPNGKRVAKYGIYWGKDDPRNGIRTLPDGSTNVAAMLAAILEAVNIAKEEEPPPSLLIYSDFTSSDTLLRDISGYAKRDFYTRNHDRKLKNAEILQEIFVAVQGLHLKIKHKPSKTQEDPINRVTTAILESASKKINKEEIRPKLTEQEKKADKEIEVGTSLDKTGNVVSKRNEEWPIVYVAVRCKENKGFISAGYCTHWPDGYIAGGKSFRYTPFPVTPFRAELAAIEEALKQTIDADLENVTIVTSSAHFMAGWQRRWIRTTEVHVPFTGKVFYDRICDLCERLKQVNFRYEEENSETDLGKELEKKCIQGLSYALVGKDKSEYELELDDLVREKEYRQEGIPVVRLYKTGTDLNAGYVFDGEEGVSCCGSPSALNRILEEAIARNYDAIIIRADSEKLIKSFEAHLEVWRRNGWRNSQHKRIAKSADWEKAWKLKQKIRLTWESMDIVDRDDRMQNKKIPVYVKT
ncbi:hypothetical protein L5515_014131 [Caenorhabditis briggsae]|uniref:RNase H type-1 domain-containing protein n=1 Tax=Caenorhabditis briggsae TaxID=6238 RepID=A0AAE9EB91_CAEBR|nr:hypothetical protein L3Y34_018008 [Caenorhabditis briggsae]UMM17723.1 hypothetical protein L5515_014131 [Caenorhabditis briggsae]